MLIKEPWLIPLVRRRIVVDQSPMMPRHGDREFQSVVAGTYASPCDELEQRRMFARHRFWKTLMGGRLFTARYLFQDEDNKVVDLGCGTGLWAQDMASYTNASEIIAVDISSIQPPRTQLPLRVRIQHMDYETAPWSFLTSNAGLIYLRCGCGSVSNYPRLYEKIYENLKPGVGYFENVEIDFQPRQFGDVAHQDLARWWFDLCTITRLQRRPIEFNHNFRQQLTQAGFTDITHEHIAIPTSSSFRSIDPHVQAAKEQLMGLLPAWIESITLGPYMRYLGMDLASARRFIQRLVDWLVNPFLRHFLHVHVITARRPHETPSPDLLAEDPHAPLSDYELVRFLTTDLEDMDDEMLARIQNFANRTMELAHNGVHDPSLAYLTNHAQNTLTAEPVIDPLQNELVLQDPFTNGLDVQDSFMDGAEPQDLMDSGFVLQDPFEHGLGEEALPMSRSPSPIMEWQFDLD